MFDWLKDKLKKDKKKEDEIINEKELVGKETLEYKEDFSLELSKNNEEKILDILTVDDEEKDESFYNFEKEETAVEENKIQETINELPEDKTIQNIDNKSQEEIVNDTEVKEEKVSLFAKLKSGLKKTRKEMGVKINTILGAYVKIDDEMLEDLEDILISADIGMETTMKIIDNLRETIIERKINDPLVVKDLLKEETKKLMDTGKSSSLNIGNKTIILVVGVNGVGKTTTIGKLSNRFRREGKSVLVAAGDTFRAAAIEQLKEWGNRANVDVISQSEGSDPAAVIYDAIEAAKSRNIDVLICDTAGRLHNKQNLMKELEKISGVVKRQFPDANKETLLVLDATTGQNAMNQAKTFNEACDITGIVLTKLDGTAKGGVVIALQSELDIPIKLVGVGEGIDDLQNFNSDDFVEAIFEE